MKAKIVGRGGIPPLLKLCDPELSPEDTGVVALTNCTDSFTFLSDKLLLEDH